MCAHMVVKRLLTTQLTFCTKIVKKVISEVYFYMLKIVFFNVFRRNIEWVWFCTKWLFVTFANVHKCAQMSSKDLLWEQLTKMTEKCQKVSKIMIFRVLKRGSKSHFGPFLIDFWRVLRHFLDEMCHIGQYLSLRGCSGGVQKGWFWPSDHPCDTPIHLFFSSTTIHWRPWPLNANRCTFGGPHFDPLFEALRGA